jgi:hypothetical protein
MSGDLVPAIRNWSAAEVVGTGNDVDAWYLRVSGEVELGNENERPHLTMSEPPSSKLDVLSLDLVVSTDGDSVLRMRWASFEWRHRTLPGAYAGVRVMWQGVEVASLQL